ncbi:chorismate mutase [Tissierella sp.]|uniref:chorismate mutase n=1 Tax=Tissierella sp. TaxID=41274 RepID=UPI002859594E|nr:chorismate mutase [Tissierella sp.]MDR7856184.1 chorismate mutase [Tissierella sp.]
MSILSIRGATTVPENSVSAILDSTKELLIEIEKANNINKDKVISIIFSCTSDLDKVYPAKAARELGYIHAGLMCFNEMFVENSLNMCIRIMILCDLNIEQKDIEHIYLKEAMILRPDLINKNFKYNLL